jgi:hypothetical protein
MLKTAPAQPGPLGTSMNKKSRKENEEEEEDNTKIQYALWSYFAERLRTPSFSMTLRIAAFSFCWTVASCTTIFSRITHNPATEVIKSSPDKEQALN